MEDLLRESLRLANLPFTALVLVAVAYWLTVILGFFHLDSLQLHLDFDGVLASIVTFLEVRAIPVSVWLSVFAISGWALSVNVNHVMDSVLPAPELLRLFVGLPVFSAGAACVCAVVARIVAPAFRTGPAKTLMGLVGKTCTVTSVEVTADFGTAEAKDGGAPILLNVRAHGGERLAAGDQARIYEYDQQANTFRITKAS